MKILGLDPGIAILGFGSIVCPVEKGKDVIKLEDFGVIETPAKTALADRLATIYDDLHTLIDQVNPDLVAIEKLFFYRMSHTITMA